MNLDQLVTFLKVYQLGSYQKAAQQLFIPQPTITHRINQLEKELGHTLLIRGKGRVELTEEGKAFLPYARAALGSIEAGHEAVERVRLGAEGKLTIGCSVSFATCVLPEVLDSFMAKHPNLSMEVCSYPSKELMRMLKERKFQLGIIRYAKDEEDFDFHCIYSAPVMLFVSPQHKFAKRKKVSLAEIIQEPLIVYQRNSHSRSLIDGVFRQLNLEYKPKYETNHLYLIKHFIKSNFGVHLSVPIYMKQEMLHKEIIGVEIEDNPLPNTNLFIAYRSEELNSLDRLFIRHLKEFNDSFHMFYA